MVRMTKCSLCRKKSAGIECSICGLPCCPDCRNDRFECLDCIERENALRSVECNQEDEVE